MKWASRRRTLIVLVCIPLLALFACALVAAYSGLLFPVDRVPMPTVPASAGSQPLASTGGDPTLGGADPSPAEVLVVADPEAGEIQPTPSSATLPGSTPTAAVGTAVAGTPQPGPGGDDQVISTLLLGYSGAGYPGGYLTDTIILAVYSPAKKSVVLFSVPRDIWVTYSVGTGSSAKQISHKLNTTYPNGGGKLTRDVVSSLIGYKVQSYAAVDISTLEKAIDEVGGVDVDVAESFLDYHSGRQHLDGARAVFYARIRDIPDNPSEASDFARSRRQRQVIQALVAKMRTPGGLLHLPQLLGLARQGLKTDRALPSIGELTTLVRDSGSLQFYEASLTSSDYLRSATGRDGMYILLPAARSGRWDQIRGFVAALLANPDLGRQMLSHKITIRNGTGAATNASLQDYLEGKGYRVGEIGSVAQQPTTKIVAASQDSLLAESLRASLQQNGISASVDLNGNGEPAITFGKDWQTRR